MSSEYFDGSPLPGTSCDHPESEIQLVTANPSEQSWEDAHRSVTSGWMPKAPAPKRVKFCRKCQRFLM
jgi:hypothetical protein